MQIPVLSAVALLSLLALHTAQGAALGEDTTLGTYAAEPEGFNSQFLNLDKLQSVFKNNDFLNWSALSDAIKRSFPFINWDFFPKT
uniref:Keratinocyte differentiation associated protein n=1 Tax=Jaculus jaculus TaxID=51337 RepID=A0A8C5LIY7_JACJA